MLALETSRLMLLPPVEDHAEDLLRNWGCDRAVFETITSTPIDSLQMIKAVVFASNKGFEEDRLWRWTLVEKSSEQPMGFITITRKEDGKAELGYSLGSKFWSQGYATEAVKAVLGSEYAVQFEQIYATAFVRNLASLRVLKKAGFEYSGMVRRRSIYGENCINPGELCHLSILRPE